MDPYKVLDIPSSSTEEEVKKAYRKLAHIHHPDKNAGNKESEAKFKEINEAYQRITNPDAFKDERPPGFSGFNAAPDIINDIFENIFGAGQARSGQNYHSSITLSFEEACFGCKKTIEFDAMEICNACSGVGATKGNYVSCSTCNGMGQVFQRHGFMQVQTTCPACSGQKVKISTPCSICNGSCRTTNHKRHEVDIPPLRQTGNVLKVRGAGEKVSGKQPGDLLIKIIVSDKPGFERNGTDVLSDFVLTLKEALLGTEKEVMTIHGNTKVKVPACVRPGQKLSLKEKGAKLPNGKFGNHLLKVKIEFPNKLTEDQKQQLATIL